MPNRKAAIYVKETAGYLYEENSQELQTQGCNEFCAARGLEIVARYYDAPGTRDDFERMMEGATNEDPPFDTIIVWKLRNFSRSLDETVLCRDRLRANGVSLISTKESSL